MSKNKIKNKIKNKGEDIMEENNEVDRGQLSVDSLETENRQPNPTDDSLLEEKKAIEEWEKELNIKTPLFDGAVVFNDWLPGKVITKKEFEKGIDDFLGGF